MRLSVSVMGVVGILIVFLSMGAPWLTVQVDEWEASQTLRDYSAHVDDTPDSERFAYGIALYVVVVGIAISVSSLLGGFVVLAGTCTFLIGRLFDDTFANVGGSSTIGEASMSIGIGFYIALVGAIMIILSISRPLGTTVGGRGDRPKFRTWHLSRK